MLVRAFLLSLQCLNNRPVVIVMAKTILITLAIFAVVGVAAWFLFGHFLSAPIWGVAGLVAIASAIFTAFAGWLLWRVVAIAVLWFFADDIIDAVEARHYPAHALTGKRPGVVDSGRMAMRSIGRVIGYNLLAAPLYLLLLFTGIGTGVAFLFINALLLGRDLQDMLEARHGKGEASFDWMSRLLLGLAGTTTMLLPFVNMLVPVVATAMAVHMAHDGRSTRRAV